MFLFFTTSSSTVTSSRARNALAVCGLLLVGCGSEAPGGPTSAPAAPSLSEAEQSTVVAKVGDVVITLKDFERRLNEQAPFARARLGSGQRKEEFLDSLIRFELLAREAEAKGFHRDADVVMAQKQAMVRKLMADEVPNLVKLSDIAEPDVQKYYDDHASEYDKPAEVRLSHLRVKDEATARKLHAELKAKIAAAKNAGRETFADYVRHHSEDTGTRESGGDLGFLGKPGINRVERPAGAAEVPPAVATSGFELEAVGELAPGPVQTSEGWHLIQKTGFKRPYKRAFDDVKQSIRNKLFRERKTAALEKFVADLKAKTKIVIDEQVLSTAKVKAGSLSQPFGPPTIGPGGLVPGGQGMPLGADPEAVDDESGAAGAP